MYQKINIFLCIILYLQFILYIYIQNKTFIQKLKNRNLKSKIIKIKKLNDYLENELEIIENKQYKNKII